MNKTILKAALLAFMAVTGTAHALPVSGQGTWETTLLGRDINGGAVTARDVNGELDSSAVFLYDTTLDITWLRDTNYAQTSGYSSNGLLTWAEANAWASGLNVGGYTGWRLPTLSPVNGLSFNLSYSNNGSTDFGYAATGTGWGMASELGYLYYVDLGNKGILLPNGGGSSTSFIYQSGSGLVNTGDFKNLQSSLYWFDLEYPSDSSGAWFFNMLGGAQSGNAKTGSLYALAVLDGDVLAPVPEPETYALMLAGLAVVGAAARRRQAVNTGAKKAAP